MYFGIDKKQWSFRRIAYPPQHVKEESKKKTRLYPFRLLPSVEKTGWTAI